MKSRTISVLALVAGLALLLLLGLVIGLRLMDGGMADRAPASVQSVAESSGDGSSAKSLDPAPEITFTPAATLHFPIVFRRWSPCDTVPTLLSPPDGGNLSTIAPEFRWDCGDNPRATQFRMRFGLDPEFDSWVQGITSWSAQGEGAFRFHENLEPDTTYYWRAWLICGEMEGPYSEVSSFRTAVEGTLPPAPSLTAPVSGTVVSSPSVTLVWEPVDRAEEYLVRYREAGAGEYRWVWTADTRVTLSLAGGKTYEWWVAALNGYGIGSDSLAWRFITPAAPAAAPQADEHALPGEGEERIIIETP